MQSQSQLEQDFEQRNQASFELNQLLQDMRYQQGYLDGQKKRKGARGNALRQRPKSSLLFDNHRDSQAAMKGNQRRSKQPHSRQKGTSYHKGVQNHSIENLQRQVLENQKILLA